MTVVEVDSKQAEKLIAEKNTLLLDIRERIEFAEFNIGGVNIPPHEINEHLEMLRGYEKILVVCSNGTRSTIIARVLSKKLPEKVIFHLSEGML